MFPFFIFTPFLFPAKGEMIHSFPRGGRLGRGCLIISEANILIKLKEFSFHTIYANEMT
jgi:hypothetical protein